MSELKAQIKAELELAAKLDLEARDHRRRAGEFLELAREEQRFDLTLRDLGITPRTAELLISMRYNLAELSINVARRAR